MSSFRAHRVAPVLVTRDLSAAVARYRALGFEVSEYQDEPDAPAIYAFLGFGGGEIHLAAFADVDPATNTSACYLYVDDAQAVFDAWSAANVAGRLVPPTGTPYGIQEMAYVDPDGNLLRIGSPASAGER